MKPVLFAPLMALCITTAGAVAQSPSQSHGPKTVTNSTEKVARTATATATPQKARWAAATGSIARTKTPRSSIRVAPGTITGRVVRSGDRKSIAGQSIVVRDAKSQAVHTTRSTTGGAYRLTALKPGRYSLEVADLTLDLQVVPESQIRSVDIVVPPSPQGPIPAAPGGAASASGAAGAGAGASGAAGAGGASAGIGAATIGAVAVGGAVVAGAVVVANNEGDDNPVSGTQQSQHRR